MEQHSDDRHSESAITGLWGTDTNGKMLSTQITTEGEEELSAELSCISALLPLEEREVC